MNQDQITGVIRAVLPAVLAYVAGMGWIPDTMIADITAATVTVIAAVWSVINNKSGKVIPDPIVMKEKV